ncbi:FAD-binding oxidoreductase [Sulfitobacter donghicola]|uniref:FAD-dependent oxidoreductase n=1 Tax=Sulfitobacter donghicola DSW-25 = KCTC 12864 = JCM 14565 TaxID=1300350 RepID=A0A073IR45_9RHOB|nr:FAD-binding oxidoreductase [Sulfitobacter donghicola]KEJ87877.1 FAD-dependent oxidoreductase [Sulfitobacter donghicola DSW-25 = KCTC 12864 = JCM 14565]
MTALKSALPEVDMLTEVADMARFVSGVRGETGKAAAVLRPESSKEMVQAVCALNALGIRYHTQGGNTGLVGASIPDATGEQVVISTERLKDVFEVDLENRSLRVSAGFHLSEVNERLEPHGLFFPIDLGSDPQIGGMIATNTGGGRFLRYGDMRQQVLGLALITSAGEAVKLRGPVRKANTGTDWMQLAIGSASDFGIITEAVLNIEPIPRQQATALIVPKDEAAILPLLQALERLAGPMLSAFEFMSHAAMEAAFAHIPTLRNPFANGVLPQIALLVELSRPNEPAAWETDLDEVLQQILMAIWEGEDVAIEDALFGRADTMWAMRHGLSEGVRCTGKLYAFDLGFRRQDVLAFRAAMQVDLTQQFPDVQICDFGHVGDGGLHFNLVVDPARHSATFEEELRDWVVENAVDRFGASFSAEHGIGPKNQKYFDKYGQTQPFPIN